MFTIAAHAPRANDVEGEEEEEEAQAQAHQSSSNNVSIHSSSHRHAAPSSSSSSCSSVFLDPTCREESMLSGSPAPMAVEDEEDVTLSASSSSSASCAHSPSHAHSNSEDAAQVATTTPNPHVRNPTSASIATSYSTDSFCSSAHASSSSSSSSSSYSASSYSISRTSSSAASSLLNSGLASSASSIHSASFLLCGDDGLSRKDTRESSQPRQGSIVEEEDSDDGLHCESRGHGHGHGVEEGMMNSSGATFTCLAQGDCSEKNTSNVRNDNTVNNGKIATSSMVQPDKKKKKIPFGPEEYASLLVNSHHPHEVLAYEACAELDHLQRRKEEKRRLATMHSSSNNNNNNDVNQESQITQHDVVEDGEDDDSRFVCFQSHPIPTNTVSFRHFRLQRYKYLTISDIVVYHPKGGLHFDAVDIARKVDVAQRKMERVRWERGERHAVRYHVYVVLGKFFRSSFPFLSNQDWY